MSIKARNNGTLRKKHQIPMKNHKLSDTQISHQILNGNCSLASTKDGSSSVQVGLGILYQVNDVSSDRSLNQWSILKIANFNQIDN